MPRSAIKFFNRGFWLFLVICAGLNIIAATLFAGWLGRIDVLALICGLLLVTFIAWFILRSKTRPSPSYSPPASAPNFGYYQAGASIPVGAQSAERRNAVPAPAYASVTATRPALG